MKEIGKMQQKNLTSETLLNCKLELMKMPGRPIKNDFSAIMRFKT